MNFVKPIVTFRRAALVFLLGLQGCLLGVLNYQTSTNRTELGHIGAAVYFYKTFRFDVFHVNPPLTRYIVGLPFWLASPEYNWKSYSPRPQDRSEWFIGSSFINANTPEKIHWCIFFSRCLLIPLILLGGWFGYQFASELYGKNAGLIFVALWTFSPFVLGWGASICPDVCASSLGIIGIYTFWHWLKNPNWKAAIIAGICLGLLPLTKLTWIIAFPLWILIWLIWVTSSPVFKHWTNSCPVDSSLEFDRVEKNETQSVRNFFTLSELKQLGVILLLGVYMINMGYGFDGSFRLLKDYKFISRTLTGRENNDKSHIIKSGNRFEQSVLGYIPVPLPAEWIQGIDTQKFDFEHKPYSYFRGEESRHGRWYCYIYMVLIKEPLGNLCLGLLAFFVTCFLRKDNADWRGEMIVILPGMALFIFISSQAGFWLHPRYIIPTLPFAYLWISKLGQSFSKKRYVLSTITTCLLIWTVGSSLYYFPHSMSYFNELIGGPKNGPKHLLGSSVDWGQNLYFLQKWHLKHPEARPIKIAYSGSLDRLGIKDKKQPSNEPEPGWFAIGVNELYSTSKQYEYFKRFEPIDMIGYSIYIYHITLDEANKLRGEISLPKIETAVPY